MTKDLNKGITNISYNHLNLPTRVTIGGKNIDYTYDAGGVKLSKTVSGVARQYAGNYVYENGVLQFFNQPEGYVSPKNTSNISQGFKYVYQYKDHLGNVRLSYTDNNNDGVITPSTEIIEESNYYPFGLKHKGYNNITNSLGNSTAQKFGYQSQELSEELGYDMYEYKYRHYDASIGRFVAIDPLATTYVYNSTYAFQENKLGLGTEVEGKEMQLHDWLVREGTTYVAKELDRKMDGIGMKKTEKSVASKHLYKMYQLQKSDNKGKAERFARNSGLGGLHNGSGDAFRHSLFNALNTQTVGKDVTKKLGDAHEEDRPGQPANEKKMDLHNNEVGRDTAESNPDASIMDLAAKLLDKMEDGEMLTLDSKGNITKSKLTKKQKAQIIRNLKKLDENGNQKKNKKKYN